MLRSFRSDIYPLKTPKGVRTFVMLHPYILDPVVQPTFQLSPYLKPVDAIEHAEGSDLDSTRHFPLGSVEACYYHEDRLVILSECSFSHLFREKPLPEDENERKLWLSVEQFLLSQFPKTKQLVTPFSDPAFETEDYQQFLRVLGYSPVAQAAYGKTI